MPVRSPRKRPPVTVGGFYTSYSEQLEMRLLGPAVGFDRKIREPTVNRPGLALTGFYEYFANKRIQVLGSAEKSYLKSLDVGERRRRFADLCRKQVPCLVISRKASFPKEMIEIATQYDVAVFRTPMVTMKFINAATIALDAEFSPVCTEHGSMVDILGIGVLVRGSSGVGKSESVLALIERGYSLVSDDITKFRGIEGRELVGTAPDLTRYHMEVRGLGIINVASIFGVGAIRPEKRLDMVVTLKDWHELKEVDRIGLNREYYDIMGIHVPHITIPVRPGRDLARLVEVAALDQKLKNMGQNTSVEFNQRLLRMMEKGKS